MGMKLMFRKAIANDKLAISAIRPRVYRDMHEKGNDQWDNEYPSDDILHIDIDRGHMYLAIVDGVIAAYVAMNSRIPEEYSSVSFVYEEPRACMHRLSVNPDYLRMGIATELMRYVHGQCRMIGYKSIVLDTYDNNNAALAFYKKLGYITRGSVSFPRRPDNTFPTMEKALY